MHEMFHGRYPKPHLKFSGHNLYFKLLNLKGQVLELRASVGEDQSSQ